MSSEKRTKQIVSILFSDIKEYSKIKDDDLYAKLLKFNNEFEKQYLNDKNNFFCKTNGDSFYICSYDPLDSAEIALNLRDKFINTHWAKNGFKDDIKVRIGLHLERANLIEINGKITDVIGEHINEAARIEPIVEPNQVFCSVKFYNSLIDEKNLKIKFIPLGLMKLAKNAGEMQLYKVLRKNDTQIADEIDDKVNSDFVKPKVKKTATEQELKQFLNFSYKTIFNYFSKNLQLLEESDTDITTEINKIDETKFSCNIYVQGKNKSGCTIYLEHNLYSKGIYFSYDSDNQYSSYNHKSFNEWFNVKHNGFDFFLENVGISFTQDNKKDKTPKEGAEYLWKLVTKKLEY